jgi:hypothetical protein
LRTAGAVPSFIIFPSPSGYAEASQAACLVSVDARVPGWKNLGMSRHVLTATPAIISG